MRSATILALLGLASAAPSSFDLNRRQDDGAVATRKLLVGAPGQILAVDFDGAEFSVVATDSQPGTGPSWLLFREPNILYAVDENSDQLRVFTFDASTNKLAMVKEQASSAGVVHLAFNADKTRMIGSAYGDGTIDVWDTSARDGSVKLLQTLTSDGELGPDQTGAHPHQAVMDPSGKFFAVNDLGTDSILIIDAQADPFKITNEVSVEPGCRPRHGVFRGAAAATAKDGAPATHYTVVCEGTNKLLTYKLSYSDTTIDLASSPRSTSTFGPDSPPRDATTAAAGGVILSANGEDLYVSNRLTGGETDSISHFRASPTGGCLKFHASLSSGGSLPRDISLAAAGEDVLFVTNMKGPSALLAFARGEDGALRPEPVAVAGLGVFAEEGSDLGPQFVVEVPAA